MKPWCVTIQMKAIEQNVPEPPTYISFDQIFLIMNVGAQQTSKVASSLVALLGIPLCSAS